MTFDIFKLMPFLAPISTQIKATVELSNGTTWTNDSPLNIYMTRQEVTLVFSILMIFTLKLKANLERWTRSYEKNKCVLPVYLFKTVIFLVTLWYRGTGIDIKST